MDLFEKHLKYEAQKTYNKCNYQLFNAKKESQWILLGGACHSSIKRIDDRTGFLKLYVPITDSCYEKADVKRWLKFCASLSFKASFKVVEDLEIARQGYEKYKHTSYVISLNLRNYINSFHVFCAVTLIRYFWYTYNATFVLLPELIFSLKSLYPELDNLAATQLAYTLSNCWETGHAFCSYDDLYIWNIEDFLEALKKTNRNSYINYILANGKKREVQIARNLYNLKQYKQLAELINTPYVDANIKNVE